MSQSDSDTETCPCNDDRGCDCDCLCHMERELTIDELLQQKAHLQSRLHSMDDEHEHVHQARQVLTALVKEQNMLEAMLQKDPTDPTRLIPIPADSPERLARLAQLQAEIDSRPWPAFSHTHRETILSEISDIDRTLASRERPTTITAASAPPPPQPQHCQCLIQ